MKLHIPSGDYIRDGWMDKIDRHCMYVCMKRTKRTNNSDYYKKQKENSIAHSRA